MAVAGLLFLWRSQHRLDRRGYLLQAGVVTIGIMLMVLGFYLPRGTPAVTTFLVGGSLAGLFFFFPDIVYYLLRRYDRIRDSSSK